jgi:hypothetical protein
MGTWSVCAQALAERRLTIAKKGLNVVVISGEDKHEGTFVAREKEPQFETHPAFKEVIA